MSWGAVGTAAVGLAGSALGGGGGGPPPPTNTTSGYVTHAPFVVGNPNKTSPWLWVSLAAAGLVAVVVLVLALRKRK